MKRLISIALAMLFIIVSMSCFGMTASAEEVAAAEPGILEQIAELPTAVVYIIVTLAVMAAIWLVILVIWLITLPIRLIIRARRKKNSTFLTETKEMLDGMSDEDKKRLAMIAGGISLTSILLGAMIFRRRD